MAKHRVKVVDMPRKVVDTHRSGAGADRTNGNAPLRPRTHPGDCHHSRAVATSPAVGAVGLKDGVGRGYGEL